MQLAVRRPPTMLCPPGCREKGRCDCDWGDAECAPAAACHVLACWMCPCAAGPIGGVLSGSCL